MSEASYQLNVQRGVTGEWSSNCLVAAYDRTSKVTGVATQTYERFARLSAAFEDQVGIDGNFTPEEMLREFDAVKREFRSQLGVPTGKNIVEARVDTEEGLSDTLARLAIGGYRTAVYLDVGDLHAVGVTPVAQDIYDVKSTWSPFPENEPVTIKDIFGLLDRAPRHRVRATNGKMTVKTVNIVALPPEPAGSKPLFPGL